MLWMQERGQALRFLGSWRRGGGVCAQGEALGIPCGCWLASLGLHLASSLEGGPASKATDRKGLLFFLSGGTYPKLLQTCWTGGQKTKEMFLQCDLKKGFMVPHLWYPLCRETSQVSSCTNKLGFFAEPSGLSCSSLVCSPLCSTCASRTVQVQQDKLWGKRGRGGSWPQI